MPGTVGINEVRIQLENLKNLSIFKCSLPGISSRHKHNLEEELLTEQRRVSIFEGEILFTLLTDQHNPDKDRINLHKLLSKQINGEFELKQISLIQFREVPERVTDRMAFAMICFQARSKQIFPTFKRTVFRPTPDPIKSAHKSLELSSCIEDGYLKIYLDPSFVALTQITKTAREEKEGIELTGLCSFRTKRLCPIAKGDGTCPCIFPGKLGYFVKEIEEKDLDKDQKEYLGNKYKGCPKITGNKKYILVKASKNGKNFSAYPSYTVYARLSRVDLTTNPELRKQYRKATLMLSSERWRVTNDWIKQLFFIGEQSLQNWGAIKINDIEIPVEIVFSVSHISNEGSTQGIYRATQIKDQQIIADGISLASQNYSGGWSFSNLGAFDRGDINRPFRSVSPYLIVPNDEGKINSARKLINWLTDEKYTSRAYGDQNFNGINLPDSRRKYNTSFQNIFKEEENIFLVSKTIGGYKNAIADIRRDWNIKTARDKNKHVIVIIPGDKESENNPFYFELKKSLVEEGIPSTFITYETLQKLEDPNVAFGPILQSLWLNIYAKMGGKPWRLANQLGNVHCFIGIGFGINPGAAENQIYAGIAHLFDNYGSWIDIASDSANLSRSDLDSFESTERFTQGSSSFKISQSVTQNIVRDALKLYQQKQTKTHENATNIVLHKLGKIYECEVVGFLEGIRMVLGSLGNCKLGLLQIEQDHHIRLYGSREDTDRESYTIYRGTSLYLNLAKTVLATTGRGYRQTSRGLFTNYPGIGTPQPLLLTSIKPSQQVLQKYGCNENQFYGIDELSEHTMALTQLHWGSLKDNVRLPITALYAHKVADLISKTDARINAWLGYYRPWFL